MFTIPALGDGDKKNMSFNAIFRYIENLRLAWNAWDPVSKKKLVHIGWNLVIVLGMKSSIR